MTEKIKKSNKGCLTCLGVILIIILLAASVLGGIYYYKRYQAKKKIGLAQQFVSAHLEQKYHKKFIVTNGKFVWATNDYTFDACPSDDPEFKFPAFIHKAFDNGVGDFYMLARQGYNTRQLIKPFVEAISPNYFLSANFDSEPSVDKDYSIMKDIRKNDFTPLQAASKYPEKIYIGAGIRYALNITKNNKERIFKGVFNLIDFLKKKGFGYMDICITFYPPEILKGKTMKEASKERPGDFQDGYDFNWAYAISIETPDLDDIKSFKDIEKYSGRHGWKKPFRKVSDNKIKGANNIKK